jgi:hypothetical protein
LLAIGGFEALMILIQPAQMQTLALIESVGRA